MKKSDRERQILYHLIYTWNLKKQTNKTKQNKTHHICQLTSGPLYYAFPPVSMDELFTLLHEAKAFTRAHPLSSIQGLRLQQFLSFIVRFSPSIRSLPLAYEYIIISPIFQK